MRYSHKLSDAIHILSYISIFHDQDLSSTAIADSVQANPSAVRRLMARMKHADLLTTRPGSVAPRLTKAPDDIDLLSIYRAVEDNQQLLHVDPTTNPDCLIGANIQEALEQTYAIIQQQAEQNMATISLQNIIDGIHANHQAKT